MAKLTKEMLDKVRHIEGFPIGKDEDIIELSDPPYYTACPNPFIEEFIKEHGKPYDETADNYHREPFAADVSEGKNDPIYNAHSYHTKVPHKAIMRYILHYTEPGDIVFDGFCGTGMTGVAAQMCGNPDPEFKLQIEKEMGDVKWGARKAVLCDLSPAATFIAYNYNTPVDVKEFEKEAKSIIKEVEKECGWMYETRHVIDGEIQKYVDGKPIIGKINYTVWSDVFVCPQCSEELVFWDVAVDKESGKVNKEFSCPFCGAELIKRNLDKAWETKYDKALEKTIRQVKQVPVLINYSVGKRRYEKKPDEFDLGLIEKIENMDIPYWYPIDRMPEGDESRRNDRYGITHVHHFYTKRNLYVTSAFMSRCLSNDRISRLLKCTLQSCLFHISKLNRKVPGGIGRHLSGTLYLPSLSCEVSFFSMVSRKINDFIACFNSLLLNNNSCFITQNSLTDIGNFPEESIDYIFTDPPFGENLMYSELNILWESWLKVFTNNKSEAIINKSQKKGLYEYQVLMERCFKEMYRILKPNRWLTMVFHNSKNSVWNAIQEAILSAGFIVADVRELDKKQGSFKQVTTTSAMKKDLVVSAYKPKENFVEQFIKEAGSEQGVWSFIKQHLEKLPVVVEKDNQIEVIAERQNHVLYDRMVAFHIQNGFSVPMGAAEFYKGLHQRFPERDGMYFLPNQVADYDRKRAVVDRVQQLTFIVSDEKSAIQWLRSRLEQKPQTYQEIQPDFMKEAKFVRYEKGLELAELLDQNFLQDEKSRWYLPDPNKQADLEKLREKALLKEFEQYKEGKGKLRVFRTEAVRAGFKRCWKNKDYETIVKIAERIPDSIIQEDSSLLMYYNNALTRTEG